MRPIVLDSNAHIPPEYDANLYRMRHSAAHVLAQAVTERFTPDGEVHFAGGPPIENGFYYDFELPRPITDEDLAWVETRMREIVRGKHEFASFEVSADEAREIFKKQPFKLETIEGLAKGDLDEDGNPVKGGKPALITIFRHDAFTDLCQGPHVASTAEINPDGIKVLRTAGAYWRGDETRPMLQRIYATAWPSEETLAHHLAMRAEAEKRDHRRLGKELELFHFDPSAPGMPYWLPKGYRVLLELLSFWREEHEAQDYQEIASPLLNEKSLWVTSGHWEHYKDDMFVFPLDEHRTYGLKPMNCPNAMVVFGLRKRSYRELPMRLSDCDILHRHERSGTLLGLLRVQKIQQDDAHIFCTEDQIEGEYGKIFELIDRFYRIFDLSYRFRLGTRPTKFLGDVETWDRAESALKNILDKHAGVGKYHVADGDGAFYGPKIDIMMKDTLGRDWQMGTIQLDFQLPRRFNCEYVDKDGKDKTPVVVHRVIYGSLERFMGILIEHTAGAFPLWLAPTQAVIVPITEAQVEYGRTLATKLRAAGLRARLDDSSEHMNAKIRNAQLEKIPYMLVVGKREVEAGTVAVRVRTGDKLPAMSVDAFVERAREFIAKKAFKEL